MERFSKRSLENFIKSRTEAINNFRGTYSSYIIIIFECLKANQKLQDFVGRVFSQPRTLGRFSSEYDGR